MADFGVELGKGLNKRAIHPNPIDLGVPCPRCSNEVLDQ